MDQRLKDMHILGGSLNPDSFSELERQFLAKNLGKKSPDDFDGPDASVGFALEWAEGADKDEVAHAKSCMVPSAPPAEAGDEGVTPPRTRKTKKKKTTKKKR